MGDDIRWFRKQLEEFADRGGSIIAFRRFLNIWIKRNMSVWSRGTENGKQKSKPLLLIARDRMLSLKNNSNDNFLSLGEQKVSSTNVSLIYDLLKEQAYKDFARDLFRYVDKGRLETIKHILDFNDNVFISQKMNEKELTLLEFSKRKALSEHGVYRNIYVFLRKRAEETKRTLFIQSIQKGDLETILNIIQYDKGIIFITEGGKNVPELVEQSQQSDLFKKEIKNLYDMALYCQRIEKQSQIQSILFSSYLSRQSWCEKTMAYVKQKTNFPSARLVRRTWNKREPVLWRMRKILGYVVMLRQPRER